MSLTGILDHSELVYREDWLSALKNVAIETNKEWAGRLGINPAAAITCVKPSGTVSQLVDSASGLHTRHSPYYLRTVRGDNKDPLTQFLKDAGVYNEPAFGKEDVTTVFYFAKKSPEGALTRHDQTALDALATWKLLQDRWCEHKPSVTISVKEDEWMDVGAWVYKNFDSLSGVSFLPYDGGTYKQAPYQELTKEEYEAWVIAHPVPEIDWDDMRFYEIEDKTTGSQEFACVSGACDVVDFGNSDG